MKVGMNFRMRKILCCFLAIAAVAVTGLGDAMAQKKPPYWASIAAGKAYMRSGPGRQFPASWLFVRAALPVKVIETYPNWRKVEDPDGQQGWMQANLLSEDRTGMIRGETQPLRASPDAGAKISWRAEAGVVGKLSDCAQGWCKFDANGKAGYVETAHIWGGDDLPGD